MQESNAKVVRYQGPNEAQKWRHPGRRSSSTKSICCNPSQRTVTTRQKSTAAAARTTHIEKHTHLSLDNSPMEAAINHLANFREMSASISPFSKEQRPLPIICWQAMSIAYLVLPQKHLPAAEHDKWHLTPTRWVKRRRAPPIIGMSLFFSARQEG